VCAGYHNIVLNIHSSPEHSTDYVKDSFYEELERVLDKFPKFPMKILLGDFNVEVGRKDIFNRQLGMKVYTKSVMIMELEQ
jgi:exonuclease III